MSIQTAPASTTFAASPENFGLKRSLNASPRTQNNQTMDPESIADSLAAIHLDGTKIQSQLASGANTIPLGSRSNKPPLKDVTNHLADAAPVAALPFSITGNRSGSSAFAQNTIATHPIPPSAFISNPNAVVVRRSAFPPMQASARPPTHTFVNPTQPSIQASAPALQKPSTIASAFNCNPNAFAAAYNARVPRFHFNFNPSFNPSPSTASAFGLPSTWGAVTDIQEDEPMDVDDPWAMEIFLPDPDAMDTSPNSENYTVPFFPYHGSQEFVAPPFGRLFQPFVPPPLPQPTHANAYNALRQLDSSTAAMHTSSIRPDLYSTSHQFSYAPLDESLLPRFSEPILDELVQRYPHSPDAILADKKRKRTTFKTAIQLEAEAKQARYRARSEAKRKEVHRRSVALAASKLERPSKQLRTSQADHERIEVPPCMIPEKTRRTLAEMKKTSTTKTKSSESSRRCGLTKVGSRLLAAACSAPRSLVGFL
ncbi:hypothetical protein EV715DRAFT_193348 [Schizophyllum commune]